MKKLKVYISMVIVLLMMTTNYITSYAAVCNSAPDGVHHFDAHRSLYYGYSVDRGYHRYLYGYEEGIPIYKDDCMIRDMYEYCEKYCIYCRDRLSGSTHSEYLGPSHSKLH